MVAKRCSGIQTKPSAKQQIFPRIAFAERIGEQTGAVTDNFQLYSAKAIGYTMQKDHWKNKSELWNLILWVMAEIDLSLKKNQTGDAGSEWLCAFSPAHTQSLHCFKRHKSLLFCWQEVMTLPIHQPLAISSFPMHMQRCNIWVYACLVPVSTSCNVPLSQYAGLKPPPLPVQLNANIHQSPLHSPLSSSLLCAHARRTVGLIRPLLFARVKQTTQQPGRRSRQQQIKCLPTFPLPVRSNLLPTARRWKVHWGLDTPPFTPPSTYALFHHFSLIAAHGL